MSWQDVLTLKGELDRLGVRILAIEHPNETQWRVQAQRGMNRFIITNLRDWHSALDAGKVPGISYQEWQDAQMLDVHTWDAYAGMD